MDSYSRRQCVAHMSLIESSNRFEQVKCRVHRSNAGRRRAYHASPATHDAVADYLGNLTPMTLHHRKYLMKIFVQELTHYLRLKPFGQCSEPFDIGSEAHGETCFTSKAIGSMQRP